MKLDYTCSVALSCTALRRSDIPDSVWAKFISTHNDFHAGSGNSYLDYGSDALDMEAKWKEHCKTTGMCHLDLEHT